VANFLGHPVYRPSYRVPYILYACTYEIRVRCKTQQRARGVQFLNSVLLLLLLLFLLLFVICARL